MSKSIRAAVCFQTGTEWKIEQVDLDPPKAHEVLVRMVASGLCHSDEHTLTGDLPGPLPIIGGHEGAGVVEEVGPEVRDLQVGDHVVMSFVPSCGRCGPCSTGRQNLCDLGMYIGEGLQVTDHTARHHLNGQDVPSTCMLGTFADHTVVNEASCVKIEKDVPLEVACLLGCGVPTGWGSAVNTGGVRPGDTVVVVGIGGIGINAVQGASLAGAERIIAVDPDPAGFKLEKAVEFGATHVAKDSASAFELLQQLTMGRMANVVINTKGEGRGDDIGTGLSMTGKSGRLVVTNLHSAAETSVTMSALDLVTMEKQVRGSLFGSASPRHDIPRLLDLYRNGKLKLDELVTRTYRLEDINQGYDDMRNGRLLRGVLKI